MVKIIGYSERGMVNAICQDILMGHDKVGKVRELLSQTSFANELMLESVNDATILAEQSFSDFGDLDLLFLLDHVDGSKSSVLVEAKVHTGQGIPKRLSDRWQEFGQFIGGKSDCRSTLFVQIYRKMRLIELCRNPGKEGLSPDSIARRWSIGKNRVVRSAKDLLESYSNSAWFLLLVPDDQTVAIQFLLDTVGQYVPNGDILLPSWSAERLGILSWQMVENMAEKYKWEQTIQSFQWNKGQIHR